MILVASSKRARRALIGFLLSGVLWNSFGLAQAQTETQTQAETQVQAPFLIQRLDRDALLAQLDVKAVPLAQRSGLRFVIPAREGVSDFFEIGVWESVEVAQKQWDRLAAPTGATQENVAKGNSDELRVWKRPDEGGFQFAVRRLNVVSQFLWRGELEQGAQWLRDFETALLVPSKPATSLEVSAEILMPAVGVANQPMPILWRVKNELAALAPDAESSVAAFKPVAVTNAQSSMSLVGNSQISLPAGTHALDFRLVTYGARVLQPRFVTQVRVPDTAFPAKVVEWKLPEKSLYLWQGESTTWEQTPSEKREQIPFFRANSKRITDATEEALHRLSTWNEMAKILRPEWLPTLEMVQITQGRQGTRDIYQSHVAYEQNGLRLIWLSDAGQESKLYVESAGTLPKNSQILTKLLLPEVLAPVPVASKSPWERTGVFSQVLRRKRSFTPTANPEELELAWIHIAPSAAITLHFPL